MMQSDYLRTQVPSILVNLSTFATVICILLGVIFPWYEVKSNPDDTNPCTTVTYLHLFYTYTSCGTCDILTCLTVSPDGGGLNIDWELLVLSITWAISILAFLSLLLGSLFSWVPMFAALRWLSRILLATSAFLTVVAFMVFLSYTPAVAEGYWIQNGVPCDTGPCHSFTGKNDPVTGFSYWGPSAGWICSVIVAAFIIVAAIISWCLASPDDSSYESITTS